MTTSETPCNELTTSTISITRAEEIVDAIKAQNFEGISLLEYLQVSFLALMSGDEPHIEDEVMYGGNVFLLHACVAQVHTPENVENLRKVV